MATIVSPGALFLGEAGRLLAEDAGSQDERLAARTLEEHARRIAARIQGGIAEAHP
jgi:hypothetical protein